MPPILICPLDRLPLRSRFSSSFPPSIPLSSLWVTRRSSGELPPLPSTCLQPFASSVCRPSKHPPTSSPGSTAKPSPPKHATPSPTVSRRASPSPLVPPPPPLCFMQNSNAAATRCSWSPAPISAPKCCVLQSVARIRFRYKPRRKQMSEFTYLFRGREISASRSKLSWIVQHGAAKTEAEDPQ